MKLSPPICLNLSQVQRQNIPPRRKNASQNRSELQLNNEILLSHFIITSIISIIYLTNYLFDYMCKLQDNQININEILGGVITRSKSKTIDNMVSD